MSAITNAATSLGASAPEIMLEVEGLNAWYGAARILFDLSLNVGRGEVVALMGRDGAGWAPAETGRRLIP